MAEYVLTYAPLAMSSAEAPHTGTVFFPLPDGTAILHSLEGVAGEPTPSGAVSATVPAKAGSGGCCSPRHSTHLKPSSIEFIGII